MPSTSAAQRRLFGAVLAAKQGKATFPLAQKIAGQVSQDQARDFASGPVQPKKPKNPASYL